MTKEERRKQLLRREIIALAISAGLITVGATQCSKKKEVVEEPATITIEEPITMVSDFDTLKEDINEKKRNSDNYEYINNLLKEYNEKSGRNLTRENLGISYSKNQFYILKENDENGNVRYVYDIYRANQEASTDPNLNYASINGLYVYIDKETKTLIGGVAQDFNGNSVNVDITYMTFCPDDVRTNYYPSTGYLKFDNEDDYEQAEIYLEKREEYLEKQKQLSLTN